MGLGDCITQREHQPVGGGVQDQPHLVGERAAAAGAIGGKLRVEFVINLKTAKMLGLTFPTTLLGRADEVIE